MDMELVLFTMVPQLPEKAGTGEKLPSYLLDA